MKKIIITGATSMLGVALTQVALEKNVEIYAIVRQNTKRLNRIINSPLVHVIYGSLENIATLQGLPNDCDVMYHFAWAGTSKDMRDNPEIHERNIKYTLEVIKLAKTTGCRRFVGAGSQAEYGPICGKIDDSTRFSPTLSYGIAKYSACILSRKLCEKNGIDHVWGRVFSVYGPNDNDETMLRYAIDCWKSGKTARFSSGMQFWNYLYETDAGEMFYRLGCDDVPPDTYLIANPESRILKDYIKEMMYIYGDGAYAEFAEESRKELPGLKVEVNRTIQVLNYIPKVSFEEGIKNLIKEF